MILARLKHWLALASLGIVWGTTWLAADSLAEYVPPLRGAAARFLLAALLWIPVILWKRLKLPRGRALGCVLLLSVTMIALPSMLLLWAQQHVSSATVMVLFAAMPLLVVLLTSAFDSRPVPRIAMQAAIIGLGGIVLAVGASFSAVQAGGAAVALLAVASLGASALLAHRELRNVSPVVTASLLLGAAALLLFLASEVIERGQQVEWNRKAIGCVIFLAMVGGAPAYAVYFWLLQRMGAYKVVTVQWIQTLVSITEAAFFLRLGLSFSSIAGTLVTLASLLLVIRAQPEDDDTVSLLVNS